MPGPVDYTRHDDVAAITLDDGRVNALSPAMQAALHQALDRAEADAGAVLLRGRENTFSGGFDLDVLKAGGREAVEMIIGGFELSRRILSFPCPVVIACGGHAIAMGTFLVASGDYRIAADRELRLTANEVAIGLTLPRSATEILRHRLTPAAFQRAAILSEVMSPAAAEVAGLIDRVVAPDALEATAMAVARSTLALDAEAHRRTKLRVRAPLLAALETAIAEDRAELEALAA